LAPGSLSSEGQWRCADLRLNSASIGRTDRWIGETGGPIWRLPTRSRCARAMAASAGCCAAALQAHPKRSTLLYFSGGNIASIFQLRTQRSSPSGGASRSIWRYRHEPGSSDASREPDDPPQIEPMFEWTMPRGSQCRRRAAGLNWVVTAWFGALIVLLFAPVLRDMFKEYAKDESMGHGFFVPVVAGYMIWQRRAELARVALKPHWSGWRSACSAFCFCCWHVRGRIFADARWVDADGLRSGARDLRISGLPHAGLSPSTAPVYDPHPQFIYGQSLPIADSGEPVRRIQSFHSGIPVLREGNVLSCQSEAECGRACSGIRSLLSLTFLALVYGYFSNPSGGFARFCFCPPSDRDLCQRHASHHHGDPLRGQQGLRRRGFPYHGGWVIFMVALLPCWRCIKCSCCWRG